MKIKHKFQKFDDYNCGPVCMQMILQKFGREIKVSDIINELNLDIEKHHGIYTTDIANYLMDKGLTVEFLFSNSYILEHYSNQLNKSEKQKLLERWINKNKTHEYIEYAKRLLNYIKDGGIATHSYFSVTDLKKFIDEGKTIIFTVNAPHLWGKKKIDKKQKYDSIEGKGFEGHFVISDECKDNKFKIFDPYPTTIKDREGIYWIDENILFNSTLLWGGNIVVIDNS